jgi:GTP-binding protein
LIPLITIIGRPNVGKSTLFNRLVGRRQALVDDEPGVTRDSMYGKIIHNDRIYHVMDTGGFEPEPVSDLLRQMREMTSLAMAEADAIIFLLDGKEGLMPSDQDVAEILRRQNIPVFFAVNKIDTKRHEDRLADFYRLGTERLFAVSAEHGLGIHELLEAIQAEIPSAPLEDEAEREQEFSRVAVIGRPNTGKSTLINRLLGAERHLVHEAPGTTRDSVDSLVSLAGKAYLFIDTAGIRKRSRVKRKLEKLSVVMALKSLERCELALLLIDPGEGATEQDARIAGLIQDKGRASIVLINKWDIVEGDRLEQERVMDSIQRRLKHLSYAPFMTVSAKTGLNLNQLGPGMERVFSAYSRRIQTPELNRFMEEITKRHPPPSYKGRPVRMYYVTQVSVRPPKFIFSVNRPEGIKESFRRYIKNQLRENYEFQGTPLRVIFRQHHERRDKRS